MDVGSACVDIRELPKTDVLVIICFFDTLQKLLVENSLKIRKINQFYYKILSQQANCIKYLIYVHR